MPSEYAAAHATLPHAAPSAHLAFWKALVRLKGCSGISMTCPSSSSSSPSSFSSSSSACDSTRMASAASSPTTYSQSLSAPQSQSAAMSSSTRGAAPGSASPEIALIPSSGAPASMVGATSTAPGASWAVAAQAFAVVVPCKSPPPESAALLFLASEPCSSSAALTPPSPPWPPPSAPWPSPFGEAASLAASSLARWAALCSANKRRSTSSSTLPPVRKISFSQGHGEGISLRRSSALNMPSFVAYAKMSRRKSMKSLPWFMWRRWQSSWSKTASWVPRDMKSVWGSPFVGWRRTRRRIVTRCLVSSMTSPSSFFLRRMSGSFSVIPAFFAWQWCSEKKLKRMLKWRQMGSATFVFNS
mmetsp:Transcript_57724/g.160914  ORF Transcript_57724/g.160914 Transcript_57724/m.160914 type:complete len:358 (+) Transcript_57724:376-1449(+)